MPFSPFWSFVSVIFNLSVHIAEASNVSSSSSTCDVDSWGCDIRGWTPTYYGWTDLRNVEQYPFGLGIETVTMTSTIVAVIDTVRDTTSTSTKYPDDYTLVPTNAEGTHVEYVTYMSGSQSVTSTLVFPTFFIDWPDEYVWSGSMKVTDEMGATKCVAAPTGGSTVPITSKPSPTGPSASSIWTAVMNYKSDYDPRGLTFALAIDWAEYWEYGVYFTQFPNQPPLTSCTADPAGPGWGAFTQTDWMTDTSTSYATSTESSSETRPRTPLKSTTEAIPSTTEAIPSTTESSASPTKTTTLDTSLAISTDATTPPYSLSDITATSAAAGSSSDAFSASSGVSETGTGTATNSFTEPTGVSGVESSTFVVGTLPIGSDTTASGSGTQETGFHSSAGTSDTSSIPSIVTAKAFRAFKAPVALSFGYLFLSVIMTIFM